MSFWRHDIFLMYFFIISYMNCLKKSITFHNFWTRLFLCDCYFSLEQKCCFKTTASLRITWKSPFGGIFFQCVILKKRCMTSYIGHIRPLELLNSIFLLLWMCTIYNTTQTPQWLAYLPYYRVTSTPTFPFGKS